MTIGEYVSNYNNWKYCKLEYLEKIFPSKYYDFSPFTYHPCSFLMAIMPLPHFPQQLRCAQYLMVAIRIPHHFLIYATTLSSISITHSCTIVFSQHLIGTSSYYLNPLSKTEQVNNCLLFLTEKFEVVTKGRLSLSPLALLSRIRIQNP